MHKFEPACFYLRKSREDQEAEARGEGETLAKHRRALVKLAKEYDVNITKIFEEVVSGESVIHRPQMLELLKEIEAGNWKSVFCMDVDRLGRGGMRDQGLILDTFKTADTLIVTPRKVYNLNDEFDEEYTEFEAFMARKELKIITRRLQSGRRRSSEEGNFLGPHPPYGYSIAQDGRRRYLVKNPEQAEWVDLIFSLYRDQYGAKKVANHLNSLGARSYTGIAWTGASILSLLKNPVYAGIIVWGKKKEIKSSKSGQKRSIVSQPRSEQLWTYDAHEPYITLDEYEEVQNIIKGKSHPPYFKSLTNPLAGLIKCADCGSSMVYRPYGNRFPHIVCHNTHCQNKSARFEFVEDELLCTLRSWLDEYKSALKPKSGKKISSAVPVKEKALLKRQNALADLKKQKNNLHDLLERGVYDSETFIERSRAVAARIAEASEQIEEIKKSIAEEKRRAKAKFDIIPRIERVLKTYNKVKDAEQKNRLLKSIIDYAVYKKEKSQKGRNFSLVLFPREFKSDTDKKL